MFLMYPYATVFVLFTNETRTVSIKDSLLPSGYAESKNPPGSRIDTKLPLEAVDEAPFRENSSRELLIKLFIKRHHAHAGPDSLAIQCREQYTHHLDTGRSKEHNEHTWEDKEHAGQQQLDGPLCG